MGLGYRYKHFMVVEAEITDEEWSGMVEYAKELAGNEVEMMDRHTRIVAAGNGFRVGIDGSGVSPAIFIEHNVMWEESDDLDETAKWFFDSLIGRYGKWLKFQTSPWSASSVSQYPCRIEQNR